MNARPAVRRAMTTDVVDSDGITTSRPDNPKAIRTVRGYMPGMNPNRRVASPVTTRIATTAERARMSRPTPVRPSAWQS